MRHTPFTPTDAAVARLVGGDPLAPLLLRAALSTEPSATVLVLGLAVCGIDPQGSLVHAQALSVTRKDRQRTAIVEAGLSGQHVRVNLLAREHLAEFPDDLLVCWLAGQFLQD